MQVKWSVGVTTVPERLSTLLPQTLWHLQATGFPQVRLFVDGTDRKELVSHFSQDITLRWPRIGAYGNWVLALQEMYFRDASATRYAIFQDDIICGISLRKYLEAWYPEKGYQNLYTFQSNEIIAPLGGGWYQSRVLDKDSGREYHGMKQQTGRGACGLVFSRDGVTKLLASAHMVDHALDLRTGCRRIDGAVVEAMNKEGWREWVHSPSLLQHVGERSTVGNLPHRQADSFRGVHFDCCDLFVNSLPKVTNP